MRWKDMPNSYKYECLMGAAMAVVLVSAAIAFLGACIMGVIYAPWVIKAPIAVIGVSSALAMLAWTYKE